MKPFDLAPFALPNTPAHEIRFEDPHDIVRVVVRFAGPAPSRVRLAYLQNTWPKGRFERVPDKDLVRPSHFGWEGIDDQFNTQWKQAATRTERLSEKSMAVTFAPLSREFPEYDRYDVAFRRTLGVRVGGSGAAKVRRIHVFTVSPPARTRLRVELDAGRKSPAGIIELSGHRVRIAKLTGDVGVSVKGGVVTPRGSGRHVFLLDVAHMHNAHRYANDEGLVSFRVGEDTFTISLDALGCQGPIWFAEKGVYIARADDPTSFREYRERTRHDKTVAEQVKALPEQSLGGAMNGQPRPHPVAYSLGCMRSRQRFWLEANGDLVLPRGNVSPAPNASGANLRGPAGSAAGRFKNDGDGRFFFHLERWCPAGRHPDPHPVLAYNIRMLNGPVVLEQKTLAVPLEGSILDGELGCDDTVVALMRFTVTNRGDRAADADLCIDYSSNSRRSKTDWPATNARNKTQDDRLVPLDKRERLQVGPRGEIRSRHKGKWILRALCRTSVKIQADASGLRLSRRLRPGQSCQVLLKVPYIALDAPKELKALRAIDFDAAYGRVREFWSAQGRRGAQLACPEPHLTALHASHLSHVQITDFAAGREDGLVNTTVGTSTYGNCVNESCMIIQELDERGLHDEARRRLGLYLKHQGTAGLLGRFSDHDGVLFGAGGWEVGSSYNQHHGWAMWRLGEHFFLSGDQAWLESVAEKLIAAAEWVFRQRRHTMADAPFSRGWERGFLPAGSLEDVQDFFYWLSTNALTWRGCDTVARALEAAGYHQAKRVRRETDAYKKDLIRGFETMRRHCPLVRLRDGRWVPYYPSRLYRRGRDLGWIREVLEGSVYLLIAGLYGADSRQAGWILDDFQDNRYMSPPYGYGLADAKGHWFDLGGFSVQPNLLTGLSPYLDRDEVEVYLWMFFNAWAACYREEIQAMVEHPLPWLGFSNPAHFKTSDQANAVMSLRHMFVCTVGRTLHLGRAIPREWFAAAGDLYLRDVATRFGLLSVEYESGANLKTLRARVNLRLRERPERILVRFRHPEKLPIKSVRVNGRAHRLFDPAKGDVDITEAKGRVRIEARY